jgi:hypothetical protein
MKHFAFLLRAGDKMAIVTFDVSVFRARYPEFSTVLDATLSAYFTEATIYCNNTDGSVVSDVSIRGMILNMLVAHIAKLSTTDLVGRVSSAGEGSVNVSNTYAPAMGSRAWFDQTRYGASAWQAMSPYRRALYIPPVARAVTYVPNG